MYGVRQSSGDSVKKGDLRGVVVFCRLCNCLFVVLVVVFLSFMRLKATFKKHWGSIDGQDKERARAEAQNQNAMQGKKIHYE